MRIPKTGKKGFTLIELLVVIAVLGVLAAVVIPNVGRFMGAGKKEAAETELKNIQAAVVAMMVDNQLSSLPNPVDTVATSDMGAFPDTSVCETDKMTDPYGEPYIFAFDKDGYILFGHDIHGDGEEEDLVNYVATQNTKGTYTVDSYGTVTQETTGY